MRTLSEHLDLTAITALSFEQFPFPALHVGHQRNAVNVTAAVFYQLSSATAPVILVQGMLRPAEFDNLTADVAQFNADPTAGWLRLINAAREALREEAVQLRRQADLKADAALALGRALSDPDGF